jgi:hypothetical protein
MAAGTRGYKREKQILPFKGRWQPKGLTEGCHVIEGFDQVGHAGGMTDLIEPLHHFVVPLPPKEEE